MALSPEEWLAQQQQQTPPPAAPVEQSVQTPPPAAPVEQQQTGQVMSPEEWLKSQEDIVRKRNPNATLKQLDEALVEARNSGDTAYAAQLEKIIADEKSEPSAMIPDMYEHAIVGATVPKKPEKSTLEKIKGGAEAALTTLTGITGGTVGILQGTLKQIIKEVDSGEFGTQEAAQRVEDAAMQEAAKFTYAPRTEAGQEYAQNIGEFSQQYLAPLGPMGAEFGTISQAAKNIPMIARATASELKQIPSTVKSVLPQKVQTPGTAPSAGSTGVDIATIRQEQASELPVPIKLTEGQKTRTFEQQRFERETAKLPEAGQPLRERFAEQNLQLQQNMDAFIDSSGATLTTKRATGEMIDKVLRDRAAKDKTKIRVLYKNAEKAGEMESPVKIDSLAKFMNENRASRKEGSILNQTQQQIEAMEIGKGNFKNNDLSINEITLNQSEKLRKFINQETDWSNPREARMGSMLKEQIDENTKSAGGELYQKARAARANYANTYENVGLVNKLLNTKPGTSDRYIALEDVLNKTVLSPSTSLDDMLTVRRLLQTKTGGKAGEGAQAWKEVQGSVLQHIQDQMLKNIARDERGNAIVSPAALDKVIKQLDNSGKLDYLFGKKGAEQLRTINEVAKDVLTAPPGAVNTSNTATVLAGLMDVAISGSAGVPVPVMTSFKLISKGLKNKKLKARVKKSLGD